MNFYDSEYENSPDGEYVATIENAEFKESQDGTPVIMMTFKLPKGKSFMRLNFNDKGKKFITWQMGVLGANTLAKEKNPTPASADEAAQAYLDVLGTFIGQKVLLKLETKQNPTNGKSYQGPLMLEYPVSPETEMLAQAKEQAPAPGFDSSEPLPF